MKRSLIIIALFACSIGALYVWLLWPGATIVTIGSVDDFSDKPRFVSVLDGLPVENATSSLPVIAAVMIDNFSSSRPQYGLAQASIVYEAPVEGGLTRYLAIFDRSHKVIKVGPVRSARPYFLDWQAEYGQPFYMHSGGSPDALNKIKNSAMLDANEFYFGAYYWRVNDRVAPHNLFTSSELWSKLALERLTETPTVWVGRFFETNPPASSTAAISVSIKYNPNYKVSWKYDSARGIYDRLLADVPYVDFAGETLTADNVVIQYVQVRSLDEEDRKEITTIGSGSARVLRDGRIIYGDWQKDSFSGRTIFTDLSGEEIKFKPGVTWIQIVPWEVVVEVIN